jgi:hypothetical protein
MKALSIEAPISISKITKLERGKLFSELKKAKKCATKKIVSKGKDDLSISTRGISKYDLMIQASEFLKSNGFDPFTGLRKGKGFSKSSGEVSAWLRG